MREIKFRAWGGGKMYSPDVIKFQENIMYLSDKEYESWVTGYDFMQYTGLKDKNGVEIYEGDILNHEDLGKPLEVVFDPLMGYRMNDRESVYFGHVELNWTNDDGSLIFEVIGNIYEHPELLATQTPETIVGGK